MRRFGAARMRALKAGRGGPTMPAMTVQLPLTAADGPTPMLTYYRCYLISQDGGFGAVREAFSAGDAEALEFGRELLKGERVYRRAEVWQQGRLVGSLAR
jgi:hypothetical protein